MSEVLLILQHAHQYQWMLVDKSYQPISAVGEASVQEIIQLAKNRAVVFLAPNENILLTRVSLPPASKHQQLQALPFAIEEQLSQDIEKLHFSLGEKFSATDYAIAIIDKSILQSWLELFPQQEINWQAIYPLANCLAQNDNAWHIALIEKSAIVNLGQQQGFYIEIDSLTLLLDSIDPKPRKITVSLFNTTGTSIISQLQENFKQTEIEIITQPVSLLEHCAANMATQKKNNLLQGEFKIRRKADRGTQRWKIPAILAVILVLFFITSVITQSIHLHRKKNKQQQEINLIYKKIFPQANSIVSPRTRIQRKLTHQLTQQSGGNFLGLLANTGHVLANSSTVKVQSLDYQNQHLVLDVQATDFSDIDNLIQAFQQNHLIAKQNNASSLDNSVHAKVTVQGEKQ